MEMVEVLIYFKILLMNLNFGQLKCVLCGP